MKKIQIACKVLGGLVLLTLLVQPEAAYACEMCFGGKVDTPTTRGIGMAMLALLSITGFVGTGIGMFFVNMKKRADLLGPGDLEVNEYGQLRERDESMDRR